MDAVLLWKGLESGSL